MRLLDLDSTNDGISGFFKLSKEIKKRKFDKIYIFNGSLRYKLLAIFAGIKIYINIHFLLLKILYFKQQKFLLNHWLARFYLQNLIYY